MQGKSFVTKAVLFMSGYGRGGGGGCSYVRERQYFTIMTIKRFLDSERMSNKCIDFKIMYFFLNFFFVSVTAICGSNTASIFIDSTLFDGKVNPIGALMRRSKF